MRVIVTALICLVFSLAVQAQRDLRLSYYKFPDKLVSSMIVDPVSDYEKFRAQKPEGIKQRDYDRFAEAIAFYRKHAFESGEVYVGWDSLEAYVNGILRRLSPDPALKVYLMRDPGPNAAAMHDGTLFVNIGLLSEVVNEDALAIILAHEIAHYTQRDVETSFIDGHKIYNRKNRNSNLELRIEHSHKNREQELVADSLGFAMAHRAGYDVSYGLSNFYFLKDYQDRKETSSQVFAVTAGSNAEKVSLSTHPEFADRIKQLNRFLSSTPNHKTATATPEFRHWQHVAKTEALYLLMENNNFGDLMETAFIYYLQDPQQPAYLYYITEAIRRYVTLDPREAKSNFITGNYGKLEKTGILENLSWLIPDSAKYSLINTTDLLDQSIEEFRTNQEAFDYFSGKGIQMDITEVLLSRGLFYFSSTEGKELLTRYAGRNNALYPDFALAMLENKGIGKGGKEVVVLNHLSFVEDRVYGIHQRHLHAAKVGPAYYTGVRKMVEKDFNKELYIYATDIGSNLDEVLTLKEIAASGLLVASVEEEKEHLKGETVIFGDAPSKKENITKVQADSNEVYDWKNAETSLRLTLIKPELFDHLKTNNIKSVEWIQASSEVERLSVPLLVVLPPVIILSPVWIIYGPLYYLIYGNPLASFTVARFKYDPQAEKPFNIDREAVNRKMSQGKLTRAVKRVLKAS